MSVFGKLFGGGKDRVSDHYRRLAKRVSLNDPFVLSQVEDLTGDIRTYYRRHKESFEERGIDHYKDYSPKELMWLGFADLLIDAEFAVELDWKGSLEDFKHGVSNLRLMTSRFSAYQWPELDEQAGIEDWVDTVNRNAFRSGFSLMLLDIDSDCYIILSVPLEFRAEVQDVAKDLHHKLS